MLTEKDYCDLDTSHELWVMGLEPEAYYDGPLILLYEAQKWLREEKHLHIEVRWYCNMWYEYEVKEAEGKVIAEGSAFLTYEDALSTADRMAVEYLKEKEYGRL